MVGEVIAGLSSEGKDQDVIADAEHIAKGLTLDAINGKSS